MAVETFVIAGGGTGGHLYPGIAIAEELQQRRRGVEGVFAGAGTRLERDILAPHGYRLIAIRSGGGVGESTAARIRGIGPPAAGYFESNRTPMELRPQAAI